ncbi:hypothetical protein EMIHUDRAFT_210715 [Emiliania huxleyi CCMP1516]|uniref:Uncharacterized protein n=2 Tax=Emiliania huxleyi TaxID=2903 RepID=A0A0D3IYL1_EMIH1|nr:hypothetical protein EMIHUDRAFT_210715 [Emiliania huxleyi CCMP1516]EOD16346.1 hypothetical protein EMIHUDRAFT_210715 [Emiliania huxleyi CCMP1516]|eukprot:XP_005768775.1 hypothetical protein EMIHUDRAFT_210715 [Emiliania huxleyi CCMP1516]
MSLLRPTATSHASSSMMATRAAATLMAGAAPYDYTLLTLQPTYTIHDWPATQRIMDEYVAETKAERGLTFCGYSTTRSRRDSTVVGDFAEEPGDKLFCRDAFPDAGGRLPLPHASATHFTPLHASTAPAFPSDSLLAHLSNVEPQRSALLQGPASLDGIELHGPAAELRKCEDAPALQGARLFEVDCGLSRLEKESGGMPLPLQLVSLHTSFSLADADAARAICKEIVATTAGEENCIYHGWTVCGDTLTCREAYGSAVGLARHCEGVAASIERLLDGPATLREGQLHASLSQLPVLAEFVEERRRETGYCSRETQRFFAAEGGFSRYEVQQSMFGFFLRR